MADEEKKPADPMKELVFFASLLVVLIVLWFMTGGPKKVDLQNSGLYIAPPSATYAPQASTTTANPPYHYQYQY